MSVIVIDHGAHATSVIMALQQWYNGPIEIIDVGAERTTQARLKECLQEALDIARVRTVHGVNLSYGGGNTVDCARARDIGFDEPIEELFKLDVPVALAAGNEGLRYPDGVSHIASSPFNITASALKSGRTADYSQQSSWLTDGYADGDVNGVQGTSFASPRLLGAYAEHKRIHGLSIPQMRSAFERTARQFRDTLMIGSALERDFVWEKQTEIDNVRIIDAVYEVILGRQPEAAATTAWAAWAAQNSLDAAVETMASIGKASGDYGNWFVPVADRMQSLYHLALHREADTGGLAWWLRMIVLRYFDHADGRDRHMDVDWRKVYATFISAAEAGGETIHHKDVLMDFINGHTAAEVSPLARKEHVEPHLYGPCV